MTDKDQVILWNGDTLVREITRTISLSDDNSGDDVEEITNVEIHRSDGRVESL